MVSFKTFLNESGPHERLAKKLADNSTSIKTSMIQGQHQFFNDPDIREIHQRGSFHPTENKINLKMKEGQCHWNVSNLYKQKKIDHIAIGYAENHEGWHQHTWGVKDNKIVETTPSNFQNTKYYGMSLKDHENDHFANHTLRPTNKPGNGNVRTKTPLYKLGKL